MTESEQTPEGTGQVADAVRGNWVDRYAPPAMRPYLRLSRAIGRLALGCCCCRAGGDFCWQCYMTDRPACMICGFSWAVHWDLF